MENLDCCSICFECLEEDFQIQKWDCSHRFHENCANMWNNGCPMCRTMELVHVEEAEEEITWSISRNPANVLDIERMKSMNIYVSNNSIPIYKNEWKDQDCVEQNHNLLFFQPYGVLCICENCNTIQCYNRLH